jgi:hypothetical protein
MSNSSISIHVSLINYDATQLIESSSPRSCGDSNQFGQVRVSLPHNICRSRSADPNLHISTLTQILQNGNRSRATQKHSTHFTASFVPNGFTGVYYTILPPSLHSQYAVIISHKGIAQMLGLPEYVASTTSHDHRQSWQRMVLNRHRWGHYIRPQNTTQAKIPPDLDLSKLTSWYSQPINGVEKSKVKLFPSNDETIIQQPSQTKHY